MKRQGPIYVGIVAAIVFIAAAYASVPLLVHRAAYHANSGIPIPLIERILFSFSAFWWQFGWLMSVPLVIGWGGIGWVIAIIRDSGKTS